MRFATSYAREVVIAVAVLLSLTIVCGVVFPLLITAVCQVVFPAQANGSVVKNGDVVVGSSVVGQLFESDRYFHGRPSATSPAYNAMSSSGSNLGPLNPALAEAVGGRAKALRAAGRSEQRVPIDLVTASGSGLDPHITPAAASWQVERVARARGRTPADVEALVRRYTETRVFFFGEDRVNVLALNRALDAM